MLAIPERIMKLLPLIVAFVAVTSCSLPESGEYYLLRQMQPPGSVINKSGEQMDNRDPVLVSEIEELNKKISTALEEQRLHDAKALYPKLISAVAQGGDEDELNNAQSGLQALEWLIAHPEISPSKPPMPNILNLKNEKSNHVAPLEASEGNDKSIKVGNSLPAPGLWELHFDPPFMVSPGPSESKFRIDIMYVDKAGFSGLSNWNCGEEMQGTPTSCVSGPSPVYRQVDLRGNLEGDQTHIELVEGTGKPPLLELRGKVIPGATEIEGTVSGSGGGEGLKRVPSSGRFKMKLLPESAEIVDSLNATSEKLPGFFLGKWTLVQKRKTGRSDSNVLDLVSFSLFPITSSEDIFLDKGTDSGFVLRSSGLAYSVKVKNNGDTSILNFGYLTGKRVICENWKLQRKENNFVGIRTVKISDGEKKMRLKLEYELKGYPCGRLKEGAI